MARDRFWSHHTSVVTKGCENTRPMKLKSSKSWPSTLERSGAWSKAPSS